MKQLITFILLIFSLSSFGQVYEGFGANATGGANSTNVYHVTNLNNSGAGSLAGGIGNNKTIVFDVAGTIYNTRLDIANISYLTIDGSTAPAPGITLDGKNANGSWGLGGDVVSFDGSGTHHCILKSVRTINAGNDGINVLDGAHDIMITNCLSQNCVDGEIDIAGGDRVTIQWCIMGASATGGPGCMLITATNVTAHHNLFSPAKAGTPGERCPLVHCNYSPVGNPNADIRNNIIWKFGRDNGSGSGYGSAICYNATGNIINNYYYTTGTSTNNATSTSDGYGTGATGKAYMAGNVSGNSNANPNGPSNHAIYAVPDVITQDACTAAALVLAQAGPTQRTKIELDYINAVTLPNCSAGPVNQAPKANAGADITLTLPNNSTALAGSGTDQDGTISSYAWTRVSGPTAFTLGTANASATTVTNMVQGTYVFKLTVTDNSGASASDNVTIIVNASPNLPPTVDAGIDQFITLPVNSITLMSQATDPDGSIASVLWSKVSGTGGTIGTPAAGTTTVTGLTAGTYVYRLTVTDNKGATATDNVTVTVIQPVQTGKTAVYFKVVYSDSTSTIFKL